jgi:hypothetical protein
MTHITAFIVALTLTGSPVTSVLCAAACGHESAPEAHCHESLTEPATTAMSGEVTCEGATIDVPYVKEDVAASQVTAVPANLPVVPLLELAMQREQVAEPVAAGWLAPPMVLRL